MKTHGSIHIDFTLPMEDLVANLSKNLGTYKILETTGPVLNDEIFEQWSKLVYGVGIPLEEGEDGITGEKNGAIWVDVRFANDRQHTFRHSKTAQPLHTDGSYDAVQQEITFFLCFATASSGGATIFVDANTVAEVCENLNPDLFQRLCSLPLSFGKREGINRTCPVLHKESGEWFINWNYYRVVAEESSPEATLREDFHNFLQEEFIGNNRVFEKILQPGEALFFHDRRVLHGRNAFSAEKDSERLIWKCGFNRLSRA